jgi:response regulator RpfG family c-di-GMP phosphodiesterase
LWKWRDEEMRSIFHLLFEKLRRRRERKYYERNKRLAWYIYKFSSSCGALKENPTRENLERLKETANQIAERLGIELNNILDIAERYLSNPCKELKISLNETARDLIVEMMRKGG